MQYHRSIRRPAQALGSSLLLLLAAVSAGAQCDRLPGCQLVWEDSFDGNSLDRSKWEAQIGDGTSEGLPAGWGNNELQYYQAENATVANGLLTITAREESVGAYRYTSARLRTLGKGDWTYGRMEMRARMPVGQGLWPAFWMLPSDNLYGGWAASGEIDIVEYLGDEPQRVLGTIHYGGEWPNNSFSSNEYELPSGGFDQAFHNFAIEWERGEIRWYVDGELYATQTNWSSTGGPYPAPFDADFHLLLNLAVGGNLPGAPDSSTRFPQELVVDWVRVYESAPVKGAGIGATGLVLEKPAKMKRVAVELFMPFENQARKRDRPEDPRRLRCAVTTIGTRPGLEATGRLTVRLTGDRPAGGGTFRPWESSPLEAALDSGGEAQFSADDIAALVDEADAAGAELRFFSVRYAGGKGKKVAEVSLDCQQEPLAP